MFVYKLCYFMHIDAYFIKFNGKKLNSGKKYGFLYFLTLFFFVFFNKKNI